MSRLPKLDSILAIKSGNDDDDDVDNNEKSWKEDIRIVVTQSFKYVHEQFLERITTMTTPIVEVGTAPKMDQSGTTATAILVTKDLIIAATLGDSRAIMSSVAMTKSSDRTSSANILESSDNSRPRRKKSWTDIPSVSAIQFSIDHVLLVPLSSW